MVPYEIRYEDVSVNIMNMPKALYLEEPKVHKMKITNLLPIDSIGIPVFQEMDGTSKIYAFLRIVILRSK